MIISGLSDPTINQLWTAYSATLIRMTQTPSPTPGTTPPPLPDLYQTSYSFSSTSSNLDPNSQKAPPRTDTMLSYTQILSLINELSNTGSSPGNTITGSASNTPQGTSTSMQDVMNAYSQLKGKYFCSTLINEAATCWPLVGFFFHQSCHLNEWIHSVYVVVACQDLWLLPAVGERYTFLNISRHSSTKNCFVVTVLNEAPALRCLLDRVVVGTIPDNPNRWLVTSGREEESL